MFEIFHLFLLFLAILIVILVLTILNYNKDVSGESGNFLPLSGGTMSGNIDAGNQSITNINNTSTTNFSLKDRTIIYGPDAAEGGDDLSLNLFVNKVALASYLYPIPVSLSLAPLAPELNGEEWVIPSGYNPTAINLPVNTTTTINQYSVPGGFYISFNNRKESPITLNVYSLVDPSTFNPLSPPSVTFSGTLPASSNRFLYWDGTVWSIQ